VGIGGLAPKARRAPPARHHHRRSACTSILSLFAHQPDPSRLCPSHSSTEAEGGFAQPSIRPSGDVGRGQDFVLVESIQRIALSLQWPIPACIMSLRMEVPYLDFEHVLGGPSLSPLHNLQGCNHLMMPSRVPSEPGLRTGPGPRLRKLRILPC
jgi:hypothetical protein